MTDQEFAEKLEQFKAALELGTEEGLARCDEILEEMGLPEVI